MPKLKPTGFDPLRDQADKKSVKDKSEKQRKVRRKVICILLLPILIVIGMYAVGGTDGFSDWILIRKSLSHFGKGTVAKKDATALVNCVNGIEKVRGNGSALAGVYCVYALQIFLKGITKMLYMPFVF